MDSDAHEWRPYGNDVVVDIGKARYAFDAHMFAVVPIDASALTGAHDHEMPLNLEIVAFGNSASGAK